MRCLWLFLALSGCAPCDALEPSCAPVWPPEARAGEPCPRAGLAACDGDCSLVCLVDGGAWTINRCNPRCRGSQGLDVSVPSQ